MVNPETWEFKTFWKNVHQQFLISEGKINGMTYKVGAPRLTEKDPGNEEFLECCRAGWLTLSSFLETQTPTFRAHWRDYTILD